MVYFKGWLPTITGKLSFSRIQSHKATSGYIEVYNTFDYVRRDIVAIQKRWSFDAPISAKLFDKFGKRSEHQFFILRANDDVAHMPSSNMATKNPDFVEDKHALLSGKIFIYMPLNARLRRTQVDKSKTSLHETILKFNKKVQSAKIARRRIPDANFEVDQLVRQGSIRDIFIVVNFSLLRSGEAKFEVERRNGKLSPSLTDNKICNHAYFFLRDLIHRHYHHEAKSDNTLKTHPASNDDYTWRRNTLYGLVRLALIARQENNPEKCKNALGIVAYAKAFQDHLARWCYVNDYEDYSQPPRLLTNGVPEFTSYDFQSMSESLKSVISSKEWGHSVTNQLVLYIVALCAMLAAFWYGLIRVENYSLNAKYKIYENLLRENPDAQLIIEDPVLLPNYINHLSKFMITHPPVIILIFLLLFLLGRKVIVRPEKGFDSHIDLEARKFSKSLAGEINIQSKGRFSGYILVLFILWGISIALMSIGISLPFITLM